MSIQLASSVELLAALGDPTRVRLLCLLEGRELTVAELTAITELSQSRVSTHLGRLRDAGLVRDRRDGALRYYRMQPETLATEPRLLWSALSENLSDTVLDSDRERRAAVLDARHQQGWLESIAGRMEHHYSPGRTWEALTRGLLGFVELGDVLDVGCGDGMVAQMLAPQARSYVAFDRNEKVLSAARKRLAGLERVRFELGDMHELPFADESFDSVLVLHVLTYAEDPAAVLRHAARVLRPGGKLSLVTLARHPHAEITSQYGHINQGFELKQLRGLLRGLEVQQCAETSRERRRPHFRVITAHARKPQERQK